MGETSFIIVSRLSEFIPLRESEKHLPYAIRCRNGQLHLGTRANDTELEAGYGK